MTGYEDVHEAVKPRQDELGPALPRIGEPDDFRLWVNIANDLIQDISAGKFTPGKPLPSKDELAERYGSSSGPPQRAFRELGELGLIYRVPGLGYYPVPGRKRDALTERRETANGWLGGSDKGLQRPAAPQAQQMHEALVLPRPNPGAPAEKQPAESPHVRQHEGKRIMPPALSTRHTLVGRLLRQYRENLGYNLDDAASVLECDRSKISRIETGQRGIRPKELRELLTEYGMDAATQATLVALTRSRGTGGWWSDYGQILRGGYLDFVIAEGAAASVWVYAPLQVPDLLRTKAYAKSVTAADPTIPEDSQHLTVEATIARQEAILHKRRTDCTVVLGEAALRQQVGDTDVHRQQLTCLADLSTRCPWLTIGILPLTADAHAAGSGGFSVLRFEETPALGLVHVSGPDGGICLDDDAATSSYTDVFTQLSRFALSPEQSAEQFRRLATR